jgi:hypothetical protein
MTARQREAGLLQTAPGHRSSLARPRSVLDQTAIRGVPPPRRAQTIGAAVVLA